MATAAASRQRESLRPSHVFTTNQYDRMVREGILTSRDRVELLEGRIVDKMPQDPPHSTVIEMLRDALGPRLPRGWRLREQKPIRTADSRPEPDLVLIPGPPARFLEQHPGPDDIGLVIEVADTTVVDDRVEMGRIYARAGLPIYWIVNIPEQIVEVYTQPRGGKSPAYKQRKDYGLDSSIPLVLEGKEVARIPVREILPSKASQ